MLRTLPQAVRVVTVADREADIYELFQAQRRPGAELLIRAAWDRRVAHPQQHLWATLHATPVQGHPVVALPKTKQRKARNAHLTVRSASVHLRPPKNRPASDTLRPHCINVVLAEEHAAPKGATPVSWMLLTTLSTATLQDALRCLEWYTRRWLVERYPLALKSGCRVEACQFETANALKRALSVYAMVACRLLWLTYVARETRLSSCEVAFTPEEWQALACYHQRVACPPTTPPPLKDATLWLAQLGGFLARKRDGEPGVIVLWRGLTRLRDITQMWRLTRAPTTYG